MSRWEVKKRCYLLPSPVPSPWVVYDRDNWNVGEFPTHAEALAYADRMARTVEVVLPRVAPEGGVTVSAAWAYGEEAVHYINTAGETVLGTRADLKPLALALLALYYQDEVVAGREQVAHQA